MENRPQKVWSSSRRTCKRSRHALHNAHTFDCRKLVFCALLAHGKNNKHEGKTNLAVCIWARTRRQHNISALAQYHDDPTNTSGYSQQTGRMHSVPVPGSSNTHTHTQHSHRQHVVRVYRVDVMHTPSDGKMKRNAHGQQQWRSTFRRGAKKGMKENIAREKRRNTK